MPFRGVNPGPLSRADARALNELLFQLEPLRQLNLSPPLTGGIDQSGISLAIDQDSEWKGHFVRLVNTTIAASITAGSRTVTPASMTGIVNKAALTVTDGTSTEIVTLTAVTATTFTAVFANSYTGPGIAVTSALNGNGYYSGAWCQWVPGLTAFTDEINCWIADANATALTPGKYYQANWGDWTNGFDAYVTNAATGGGGGSSTQFARATSTIFNFAITLSPGANVITPSSMQGIFLGSYLTLTFLTLSEVVLVTAVTGTTFTVTTVNTYNGTGSTPPLSITGAVSPAGYYPGSYGSWNTAGDNIPVTGNCWIATPNAEGPTPGRWYLAQSETALSGLPVLATQELEGYFASTVNTTIAGSITLNAIAQFVTPASMHGIFPGATLTITKGTVSETVAVVNVTATTFSAIFLANHAAASVVLGAISPAGNYPGSYAIWNTTANRMQFVANTWIATPNQEVPAPGNWYQAQPDTPLYSAPAGVGMVTTQQFASAGTTSSLGTGPAGGTTIISIINITGGPTWISQAGSIYYNLIDHTFYISNGDGTYTGFCACGSCDLTHTPLGVFPSTANTTAVTQSLTVTGGSLLVIALVFTANSDGSGYATTVPSFNGVNMVLADSVTTNFQGANIGQFQVAVYTLFVPVTVTANLVVAGFTPTTDLMIMADSVTAANGSLSVDVFTHNSANSGSPNLSITPLVSELVLGYFCLEQSTAPTPGTWQSPFSDAQHTTITDNTGTNRQWYLKQGTYQAPGSTTPLTPTLTGSVSTQWGGVAIGIQCSNGPAIGQTVTGSSPASVLFSDASKKLNQDKPFNFAYDPDGNAFPTGSGGLGFPNTLYLGDYHGGINPGVIATRDIATPAWQYFYNSGGLWSFSGTFGSFSCVVIAATSNNALACPSVFQGFAGQTADLSQWYSSTPTKLARVNYAGRFISTLTIAPIAGDLATNDSTWWLTNTTNAPAINFSVKDGAGTFFSNVVAGLYVANTFQATTATTNAAQTLAIFDSECSGSPTTAFGGKALFNAKDSTTANQQVFEIDWTWPTATHASRKGKVVFSVYDTAARIAFTMQASGTVAQISFFSAAAVSQQATTGTTVGYTGGASTAVTIDGTFTGNTGATAYTIADVIRALKNYGLLAS